MDQSGVGTPTLDDQASDRRFGVPFGVVLKGDQRLLLQDAAGLFAQQQPQVWQDRRRTVQSWDEEGFTTCEGVQKLLRVVHTVETVRRRERVARQWQEKDETASWYWA